MYNCKINTRVCELFTLNWNGFSEKENFSWDKRKENIQMIAREFFFGKYNQPASEYRYFSPSLTFMKILINQEHNLLPAGRMYVVKILCQVSLPSFLTWVSLTIFCLDQCQMDIACLAQHLCHYWQKITHWCMTLEWWQLLSYM